MPHLHGSTANLAGQPSAQKEREVIYKDIFDKGCFGEKKEVQETQVKETFQTFKIYIFKVMWEKMKKKKILNH